MSAIYEILQGMLFGARLIAYVMIAFACAKYLLG